MGKNYLPLLSLSESKLLITSYWIDRSLVCCVQTQRLIIVYPPLHKYNININIIIISLGDEV